MAASRNLVVAAFASLALVCSAEPVNRPRLIDERGAEVDFACVVPLYSKLSGVAWSVKGKANASQELYLMKPFRFANGDDFLAKIVPWGRKVLPFGVMSFGDGWELDTRLLLRSGYKPVTPALYNKYVEKTLTMPRSSAHEAKEALEILLATPPDQNKLRTLFGVKDPIQIELNPEEITLLRSCIE